MNGVPKNSSREPGPMLIQVLPQLAPGRNGVSDQATLLADTLKKELGIESAFVVLNNQEKCDAPYTFIECPPSRLLESCLKLTQDRGGAVLVHLSGYGYSPDGAPMHLASALEKIRADGRFRIATYFHEIYAPGQMPWKSAFWHVPRQKKSLRRLVAQSDLAITNTTLNQTWLSRKSRTVSGAPVEVIPVFSAAGESDRPASAAKRSPAMVIFGLPGTRQLAYQKLAAMNGLLGTLGVEEILDVGPECAYPSAVKGVPVKRLGLLPFEELPAVFSQVRFGFVTHEWLYLARSSVLAAYCAQGVVPVLAGPIPRQVDGLEDGVNIISAQTAEAASKSGLEKCGLAAWNWYRKHGVHVHAERYARWMGECR